MNRVAGEAFDLTTGPLLRLAVFSNTTATQHILVLTVHHIVSDGWSMNLVARDLLEAYEAFAQGHAPPLRPPELLQYGHYVQWLEQQDIDSGVRHWVRQLGGLPPLELPTDIPRPAALRNEGAMVSATVPAEVTRALAALGRAHGATLFHVLLTAVHVLLQGHSQQQDLGIGIPVANRSLPETENMVSLPQCRCLCPWRCLRESRVGRALTAPFHQKAPFLSQGTGFVSLLRARPRVGGDCPVVVGRRPNRRRVPAKLCGLWVALTGVSQRSSCWRSSCMGIASGHRFVFLLKTIQTVKSG